MPASRRAAATSRAGTSRSCATRRLRRQLADLSAANWARYLAESAAGYRAFNPIDPAPADIPIPDGLAEHPMLAAIETVPEVLVITVDLRVLAVLDRDLDRFSVIGGASIYPFVHNILLAARNQGLGGVLTTFLAASEPEAAPLLGLPERPRHRGHDRPRATPSTSPPS